MKNLIIFLTLITFNILNVLAQEHLSFKGIPIEGNMNSFCQQLKTKGFTQIGKDNNITLFKGDFTGREATVGVGATDDGNSVHSVIVLFDPSDEWNNLVSTYNYYKNLYIRKYGNPTFNIEKNPSHSDSNISLMYEIFQGRVQYISDWEVSGGTIELAIEKANSYGNGIVIIKYRDSINIENKIQKDLEDI